MSEQSKEVLIVEDELHIAEVLQDYLKQAGFATEHISKGNEVVPFVKSKPPDLILLDLMLPGLDGLSICRSVRTFSTVPIIMVTAKVEEVDRLIGLEVGADDYICKPFSPREVVARVKTVLRRSQQVNNNTELDGPCFEIDEEQARAQVSGVVLDLTPTEFRILKILVQRPGRVFSRSQIIDLCSREDQFAFDRVIDSHVKNLRKKIARVLPDREVIHSVYGMGYRFEYSKE